jgi:predicted nucleic acid-binding Zn finger protein
MKKGKKATAAIWDAQKTFLEESFKAAVSTRELDPLLTVHPDEVSIEVFSKDESAWARLAIKNAALSERSVNHGSTFVELGKHVLGDVESIPAYRPLRLEARSAENTEVREARFDVPNAWLRGFLQVQSAATLPSTVCTLAPIDLYNVLLQLRLKKAKNPPRGLRFELIPGEKPRVVIEPWEVVLETHGPVFAGAAPRVARLFGRNRLALLQRLLPWAKAVHVHVLGAGLPSFFVVEMENATLTLGLSGWTESSWASAVAFDALMPSSNDATLLSALEKTLNTDGPQTLEALVAKTKKPVVDVRGGLQRLCLRGQVAFDIADGVYRPRSIFGVAVDDEVTAFGSEREREAHRLLSVKGAVNVTKLHDRGHDGIDVVGEVKDKTADRVYAPRFTTDVEGRVSDAWCSCPHYRRTGMREGPCAHMIALRVAFGRQRVLDEERRNSPEGRQLVRAETRTLLRRDQATGKQTVMRVSLDDKIVRLEWGLALEQARHSRIWFDTDSEARDAYFQRLDVLMKDGFLDADRSLG